MFILFIVHNADKQKNNFNSYVTLPNRLYFKNNLNFVHHSDDDRERINGILHQ